MKLVASVAQAATHKYDLEATLIKLERLVKLAKERDGSGLIVFPEAFLGGYPKFKNFGAVVGTRSDEGRQEYLDYYKGAVDLPGPVSDRLAEIAKAHNMFIVCGVIERERGTLHCTVVFVGPTEGLVYKRRKIMPTASERLIWGFGDETSMSVVKYRFGSDEEVILSSATCWENMHPLLRSHYYAQGTQIHCVATVDGRDGWSSSMRHIATEGRCFVLNAAQFAQQRDYPESHPVEGPVDPEGIMIAGGSMIVSPLGNVLAGPLRGEEGVLSAELDLDEIIKAKFDLDVAGHYARADLFKLTVRDS